MHCYAMQDISSLTKKSDYYYFKFIITYQLLGGGLFVSPESQQHIKAIYPSNLWFTCAVLISVIFCSTKANSDLGASKGSDLIPS